MQSQITVERERRALIAASEGRRQEQINIVTGEHRAFIAHSEGEKQAAINKAQGDASAITEMANAKMAQDAKTTLIVLGNMREVSGLFSSVMQMVSTGKQAG
jgi:regulator of protease activity HflC (stomatin/prohibitin superfamily)